MKQKFQPKILINKYSKPIAVQLSIKEYDTLIEELENAYDIKRAEKIIAKGGKTHTLEEIKESLKKKEK